MKINNLKSLIAIFFVSVLLGACQKENFEPSKATFWPNIEINGDAFVIVPVGTVYTDASATVTVNDQPIDFTTEGTVDVNTPGYYTISYSAVNEDGISASQTREVLVVDTLAANEDLSGTYQRSSNTPVSIWVKDGDNPYKYTANNPGGVNNNPPFNVDFTIYCVEPGIVVVPLQSSGALAPFYCTASADPDDTRIPINPNVPVGSIAYAWFVNGPNFSVVLRSFKKI